MPLSSGSSSFIARVTAATTATADQLLSLTVNSSTNHPVVPLNLVQFKSGNSSSRSTAPGTSYAL
ncbi:MAG: hypothetical protein WBN22_02485 [Verrucomicrobiia bacterium]